MKTLNRYAMILACLLMVFSAHGLEDSVSYEIMLMGRSLGDKVELRWAPAAKETWLMGNQSGYVLERKKIDGEGWKLLAEVEPYSLEEWKSKTDTTDGYVAIAAMTLLSRSKLPIDQENNFSQYMAAAQESDNKYAFAMMSAEYSKQAAQGLALYYLDADIKKGETVYYRVYVKHRDEPYSGDTAQIKIYTNLVDTPKPVRSVTAEAGDRSIEIFWSRPQNVTRFSGYFIEKSYDDGKSWRRMNERPYVRSHMDGEENNNYSWVDTNVVNYRPYQYRIIGITSFAEEGLPSEIIEIEGIDLTGPIPPSMVWVEETMEPGKFEITWEATTNAPDHAGFYVGRSGHATGPFEKLNNKPLSLSARSYVDPEPSEFVSTYYTVFSVDDKGNENMSVVAVGIKSDSIPPAQPVGLTGNVDSLGQVMLAWEMNSEDDLKGYRVYRGNNESQEFIQLTAGPVPGNFYFDTISLRTLTKKIYYQVVAVDHHYNPSPYSAALEISKPDYIPPASPSISHYEVLEDGVRLDWKVSPSDDAEVQGLYRKKDNESWIILKEFNNNRDSSYLDTTVEVGNFYTYTMVAVDDAGLYSKQASPVRINVFDRGIRDGVYNLSGALDKDCACFLIEWEFKSDSDHHFVIYRDENLKGLQALTTLGAGSKLYRDKNVYAYENGYEYRIKVVYGDGGESPMSAPIKFKKK